jgi:hypothetical protein
VVEKEESQEQGCGPDGSGPPEEMGQGDDSACTGDQGKTIGHDPIAHEPCLIVSIQDFEVEAVDGDVMCGRDECDQQEQAGAGREGDRCFAHSGKGQGEETQESLGDQDPFPFCPITVEVRSPEELQRPGKSVERGHSDRRQRGAMILEVDGRDLPDQRIRETFCKVGSAAPDEGAAKKLQSPAPVGK